MKANLTFSLTTSAEDMVEVVEAALKGNLEPARKLGDVEIVPEFPALNPKAQSDG